MIRDTQIQAYNEEVKPTLQKRQQDVLNIIKKHPGGISIYEVASIMDVMPNTVSGRFGELEKIGAIEIVGKKVITWSNSNRKHNLWALKLNTPEGIQTALTF